ncbi:uncharacterized protein LOC119741971 [Patiria miniata]|uniref:Death domain-containing protein n=1 Tax=Patiria miniata TaxID=46514 RepID=A0A914BCZ6_PATMI|nr:uncharacterized protein LOC119741971 [Patiria miniata]
MMAGIENHDREQPRVEKVVIVHAGEDLDKTIRPLASILEQRLKLGEQADYKRNFRPGTDVADYIRKAMLEDHPEEHTRLVVVLSEIFVAKYATSPSAFREIKSKLLSRPSTNSKFAVVCPSALPAQLAGLRCIILDNFVNNMEGGNVAEAIFKEWFGPQATLASQAQLSMQNLPLTSHAAEEFTLDKVKIIHAMTRPEHRQRYWGKIGSAIEDVANPENTTQARLHFRQSSVAQTVLGDVEGFRRCAEIKKINAVVIWCSNMLASLNQDPAAKAKVIEMLCNDTQPKKLFAHFLFGVERQQMQRFSQQFWTFLAIHKHMAYIDAAQLEAPNVDYNPYASIFLRSWAGSREPKSPEESLDPTMTSLEDISQTTSGSTRRHSDQFQPQQNQNGHHLVMNGDSLDQNEVNRTQQTGKALRSADSSTKDRLLTDGESWDLGLVASANKSRESQSDGCSNPPGNWSLCSPRGEPGADPGQQQGPVQQPMPGSRGQNRLATCGIQSVSVDSQFGHMQVPASGPQGVAHRGAVSLPPGSVPGSLAGDQRITAQPHQPVSRANSGQNKFAPSGFQSQAIDSLRSNASSTGQEPTSRAASDATGTVGGNVSGSSEPAMRHGDSTLSLQQNPVRLSSDAAQELDVEMSLCTVGFPSVGNQSMHGQDRASALTSNRQSFPSMGQQSAQDQDTASVMSTSQSMPEMSPASSVPSSELQSVAEGANPMQNGESSLPSAQAETDQEAAGPVPSITFPKPVMRGLELRLDPIKSAISDWRDLASQFKVPSELITYWKGMMSTQGNSSPTENLIEWLNSENKAVTVEDFKDALRVIVRFDVLKYLTEKGY